MKRASPLDTGDREPGRIENATDHPRLLLEGALDCLVEGGRVVQVDNVDMSLGGPDHEQLVPYVHGVDPLLTGECRDGRRLPEVPISHRLIPRAGRDHRGVSIGGLEEAHRADGRVVRGHLLGSGTVGREIQDAGSLVCSSANDFLSIL